MFFSVLSKVVGLRVFSLAGGAPTSTKTPREQFSRDFFTCSAGCPGGGGVTVGSESGG